GGPSDLRELCLILSAWMFFLGKRARTLDEGQIMAEQMIASGKARDKFREMVGLQGGNPAVIDDPGLLPRARYQSDVASATSGVVTEMMCEQIGTAGVLLGGGREKKEDAVDPAVGIIVHKKLGDKIAAGEALCTVHYNSAERFERAKPLIVQSYTIGSSFAGQKRPLVGRVIGGEAAGAANH